MALSASGSASKMLARWSPLIVLRSGSFSVYSPSCAPIEPCPEVRSVIPCPAFTFRKRSAGGTPSDWLSISKTFSLMVADTGYNRLFSILRSVAAEK